MIIGRDGHFVIWARLLPGAMVFEESLDMCAGLYEACTRLEQGCTRVLDPRTASCSLVRPCTAFLTLEQPLTASYSLGNIVILGH